MTKRADVIAAARALIGTPYHHQGRTRAGLDCIGIVVLIGRELQIGRPQHDRSDYRIAPDGEMFRRQLQLGLDEQPEGTEPRPGDVILTRQYRPPRFPTHAAIVAEHPFGGLSLIHADRDSGKVCEVAWSGDVIETLVAVYRWPGLED